MGIPLHLLSPHLSSLHLQYLHLLLSSLPLPSFLQELAHKLAHDLDATGVEGEGEGLRASCKLDSINYSIKLYFLQWGLEMISANPNGPNRTEY